jgi:hypothetical protein
MSGSFVGAALFGLEVVAGIVAFAAALFFSTELLERRLDAPEASDQPEGTRKLGGARRRHPSPRPRETTS